MRHSGEGSIILPRAIEAESPPTRVAEDAEKGLLGAHGRGGGCNTTENPCHHGNKYNQKQAKLLVYNLAQPKCFKIPSLQNQYNIIYTKYVPFLSSSS